MKLKLKDPGSAITHGIAMLLAIAGAAPLIVKAARRQRFPAYCSNQYFYPYHDSALCSKHTLPLCRLYRKGKQKASQNRSYDDFYYDSRKLHTSVPHCPS